MEHLSQDKPAHSTAQKEKDHYRALKFLLGGILLLKLFLLGIPAITDPSEARFANAGLHMLLAGDWGIPMIHGYTGWRPYEAKPPFHMWCIAESLELFGINEWSARLPSFLWVALSAFLLFRLGKSIYGNRGVLVPLVFLTTASVFYFQTFTLTDGALAGSICLAMYTAYQVVINDSEKRRRLYSALFFLTVGISFILKGPVGGVLIGSSIGLALFLTRRLKALYNFSWVTGISIFLLIAVPWYLYAEYRNPGFIKYFFLKENFGRYLFKDVAIEYGTVHTEPYGTIWIFLLATFAPWTLFLLEAIIFPSSRRKFWSELTANPSLIYLACWAITPLLFFTFARQILPTYTFPSIAPLSLLSVGLFPHSRIAQGIKNRSWIFFLLLILPLGGAACWFTQSWILWGGAVIGIGTLGFIAPAEWGRVFVTLVALYSFNVLALERFFEQKRSTKAILQSVPLPPPSSLAFFLNNPHSGQFYGAALFKGRTKIYAYQYIDEVMRSSTKDIILKEGDYERLSEKEKALFDKIEEKGVWVYLRKK